jgi:hypothetical protein
VIFGGSDSPAGGGVGVRAEPLTGGESGSWAEVGPAIKIARLKKKTREKRRRGISLRIGYNLLIGGWEDFVSDSVMDSDWNQNSRLISQQRGG